MIFGNCPTAEIPDEPPRNTPAGRRLAWENRVACGVIYDCRDPGDLAKELGVGTDLILKVAQRYARAAGVEWSEVRERAKIRHGYLKAGAAEAVEG